MFLCLGMDNSSVYSVHIWYLACSLRSLVRYQCENSKIPSISPSIHVLFSMYLLNPFFWDQNFQVSEQHNYLSFHIFDEKHLVQVKKILVYCNSSAYVSIMCSKALVFLWYPRSNDRNRMFNDAWLIIIIRL